MVCLGRPSVPHSLMDMIAVVVEFSSRICHTGLTKSDYACVSLCMCDPNSVCDGKGKTFVDQDLAMGGCLRS